MTGFWIAASFLIGAVPTAYLMGRGLRGIDIRQHGSGNVGATNVFRVLGKGPGFVTLAVDMLKGLLPVLAAQRWAGGSAVPLLSGLAAVAGHTWTPFLRFKGGKGVATSGGVFAALLPLPTLAASGAFLLFFLPTKTVSLGSLAAAVTLPVAAFLLRGASPASWLALGISGVVVLRHIPNIKRLLRGEEKGFKKP